MGILLVVVLNNAISTINGGRAHKSSSGATGVTQTSTAVFKRSLLRE